MRMNDRHSPTRCHVYRRPLPARAGYAGFTLIELLVVVTIIALLIAVLIPALGRAKQYAITTYCLGNLSGIGKGLVIYQTQNNGLVVPSYNMTGSGTSGQTVDGWAAILDRDGVVPSSGGLTANIFYCPNTLDIAGMDGGQTGTDLNKPQGYQDWPTNFLGSGDSGGQADPPLPLPGGFIHEIRCSYWLNAYNPTGSAVAPSSCPYYTQSVGYVFSDGSVMTAVQAQNFVRPAALIVATDGVYMGRQSVTQLGNANSRIGYRHHGSRSPSGKNTSTNAVFADGHAEPIDTTQMPLAPTVPTPAAIGATAGGFSFYANY